MIQIFILGSSSVYGVGSENGGWADLIKQSLHKKMYSKNGVGEKIEVFNFGKSGATIDFVIKTFPQHIKNYYRGKKLISIVSVGGNNAKAENHPENYVSTLVDYMQQQKKLLGDLKEKSSHVIVVGGGYYDRSKTYPKHNPLTGGKSYFSNERMNIFEGKLVELCNELEIPFIKVGVSKEEWLEKYISVDGLHPNQNGYELFHNKLMNEIEKLI